jgi:potassium-dependent mechanosensitive channel
MGLAFVVSATRLFEALNEIVGASLPIAVSMRGLAAITGAIVIGVELWRFGNALDANDCLGPKLGKVRDWFDLLRAASWTVAFVVFVSVLIGYAAFGSFLVDQFFWVGAVASLWFMSVILVEVALSAGFTPNSHVGRRLITSIGIHRNSLELVGVLISGAIKLALFGLAAVHVLMQWTDSKLLPRMNFDVGLRSSIRTSLSCWLRMNGEPQPIWLRPAIWRQTMARPARRYFAIA